MSRYVRSMLMLVAVAIIASADAANVATIDSRAGVRSYNHGFRY